MRNMLIGEAAPAPSHDGSSIPLAAIARTFAGLLRFLEILPIIWKEVYSDE